VSKLTAVYDACVLYPAGLRSTLMYVGLTGLIQVRWSEAIHDEWIRNVLKDRQDITSQQLERTRRLMNTAIPDSLVVGYEPLVETLKLPDPNDRHVLAAAIHANAEVIVTFNSKDFPQAALAPHSIKKSTPDAFVLGLLKANPILIVDALRTDRMGKKRPPKTPEEYLEALIAQRLPRTAAELRQYIDEL